MNNLGFCVWTFLRTFADTALPACVYLRFIPVERFCHAPACCGFINIPWFGPLLVFFFLFCVFCCGWFFCHNPLTYAPTAHIATTPHNAYLNAIHYAAAFSTGCTMVLAPPHTTLYSFYLHRLHTPRSEPRCALLCVKLCLPPDYRDLPPHCWIFVGPAFCAPAVSSPPATAAHSYCHACCLRFAPVPATAWLPPAPGSSALRFCVVPLLVDCHCLRCHLVAVVPATVPRSVCFWVTFCTYFLRYVLYVFLLRSHAVTTATAPAALEPLPLPYTYCRFVRSLAHVLPPAPLLGMRTPGPLFAFMPHTCCVRLYHRGLCAVFRFLRA